MNHLDEKYSYSRLEVYVNCPFKYKLVYVDKHKAYTNTVNTEIGTLVHKTEETIANHLKNGEVVNYIELKDAFEKEAAIIKEKYKSEWDILDKSGRTFDEKLNYYLSIGIYRLEEFMKVHPTYEIIGIEQAFEFMYLGRYKFKGYIDRVFRDTATDTYIIQDIKTWPKEKDPKELATPLQFVVYTLAAKSLWGATANKVRCEYDLPFCSLTQSAGTSGYLTRGMIKLDKLFADITSNEFAPKPSPLCNYCAFCRTSPEATDETKYLCPYYMHWTRENRKDFTKENEWQGLEKHQSIVEAYNKKYHINS